LPTKPRRASLGWLSALTHNSIVISPVMDKDVLSAASKNWADAEAKATAIVEAVKGKSVVHSVAPLLVNVLALAVLSLRSIAMS